MYQKCRVAFLIIAVPHKQRSNFYDGNVSKNSILDIVRNSRNIVCFDSEEEFYKDIDEQYDSYQNAASFEEVEER